MENMVNHTDEQLVLLAGKGSEMAFSTLYERYRSQVFIYILSIAKDETLAEDFAQETYIKVLLSLRDGRYEHNEKYLCWVKRVAHNVVFDHFRRIAARKDYYSDDDIDEVDVTKLQEVVDDSMDEVEMREQLLTAVESGVNALPAEQVSVVMLHYWQGMSFKDIALQQNLSINTVLGRMHYAVLNLRKLLTGKIA